MYNGIEIAGILISFFTLRIFVPMVIVHRLGSWLKKVQFANVQ